MAMDQLWQDLRFAARSLSRAPGLTIVALLTLGLGIGANSTVFSLVNAVLLRPLPFAEPDRLTLVYERRHEDLRDNVSGHEFVAWRDQNRSFDGLAMFGYAGFTLSGRGEPMSVTAQSVTASFFDVLAEQPLLGRGFRPGDDQPGAAHLVVLGRTLWARRFGSDSTIVGKQIVLDDTPYEVVGVMDNKGDLDADLWVAMNLPAEAQKVGKHSNLVIGRLARGATIASAQKDLEIVAKRLETQLPIANKDHSVRVASLNEEMVGDVRRPVMIALGSALFVLLLACANVGHLLLTRAAARQKELAIRTALGASRSRVVRHLVTEALLLSTIGGAIGLLIAVWTSDLLRGLAAVRIPRLAELSVDWTVVGATGLLCVVTGLACGLAPGLRSSAPRLRLWLNEGTRGSAGPGKRIASFLVISEIAIALMLLVGAGLTLKSFVRLLEIDPGFDARNVLTVGVPLPGSRYLDATAQRAMVTRLMENVAAVPGVRSVGATSVLPLGQCCNSIEIRVEGKPEPRPGEKVSVRLAAVAGNYFDALRIPVRQGRVFAPSDARTALPLIRWYPQQPYPAHFDDPQAAPVAVISQAMAERFWPNEPVIGKRFRILESPYVTVIGVVGDARQANLVEPIEPQMYLSNLQEPSGGMTLVARTEREPTTLIDPLRRAVHAADAALPIASIEPMERVVWRSIGRPRFNALLLGLSGVIALLLAIIGVYGVISYVVERRTHEIGIRRALGAQTRDVLSLVFSQVAVLVAVGIAVGTIGAVAVTRLLSVLLYDVRPTDPWTFATVAALLGVVAVLASYVPGRRAVRVDPTSALKSN